MPLRPQPKIMINCREMKLTQHAIRYLVRIQRVWRGSWRHMTTEKMVAELNKMKSMILTLTGLRIDDIHRLLSQDPKWKTVLPLAHRLVMLCQLKAKQPLSQAQSMVACLDSALFHAVIRINVFIDGGDVHMQDRSAAALGAFERVIASRVRVEEDVWAFNGRMQELLVLFAGPKRRAVDAYHKALETCASVGKALKKFTEFDPNSTVDVVLEATLHYLKQRVSKHDVAGRDIPDIKAKHQWTGRMQLVEVLEYERLLHPAFVFTGAHLDATLTMDIYNRNAEQLLIVIRAELDAHIDASKSLVLWHALLFTALKQLTMKQPDQTIFNRQKDALRSGRMTWDAMMRLMDAIAELIGEDPDSAVWAKQRKQVRGRHPDTITAFMHGLRVLWGMMREASIRAVNELLRTRSQTKEASCQMIAEGLLARRANFIEFLYSTETALKATAAQYPGLRKQLIERVRGARLSLHGLFVAHVMFRRDLELNGELCPAPLKFVGPRLLLLRRKAHRLSDTALLIDACRTNEERAGALAHIRNHPTLAIVPMFMPMLTSETVDRTVYADKHTRARFERELVKFIALCAMGRVSHTLPGNLACLQDQLSDIVSHLREIIDVDLSIFRKLYGELIGRAIR